MSLQELANKHGLSIGLVRVKAAQLGIPSENLTPEDEQSLLTAINGSNPSTNSLPEAEQIPQEKPKRGRKKTDSQLAKKAASDLENSASGASEVQATFTTSAATLRAQEMLACADVVAATGYAAFTARLAQNDAAFLTWLANGTNQAIANNANAVDPQQILDKLGVPNSAESLGKLQAFSTNLGTVEDVAANVRFYAD